MNASFALAMSFSAKLSKFAQNARVYLLLLSFFALAVKVRWPQNSEMNFFFKILSSSFSNFGARDSPILRFRM